MNTDVAFNLSERHQHRMWLVLVMRAVVQGLAEKAPLHRKAVRCVHVHDSVDAPRRGDVVENDIAASAFLGAEIEDITGGFRFIAEAESHVADDDVRTFVKADAVITYCDSAAGCGLTSESEPRDTFDSKLFFEPDRPACVKNDCAWQIHSLCLDRISKAARSAVVQVGHLYHRPATAPNG